MLDIIHRKNFVRNSIGILIGSIIYGMAYAWFLIPYKIAPGGVGGLSQIFYHFFGIPAGTCMLAFNIPLFIMGIFLVGKQFGIGTFSGFLLGSVFTDLLAVKNIYKFNFMKDILEQYNQGRPIQEWAMTDNTLLAAIAGSILLGAGIGIIFRSKGSTGGTDIPVAILKKYYNMSITTGYLVIETGIIFLIGIMFKNPNLIIWGFFNLYLSSKVCDLTAEGLPYTKGVYIVTDKPEEVAASIMEKLERGVTYFYGEGAYSGKKKKIVMCVINRRQINIIRDWVRKIDPNSFIILTEVSDVMGSGFKSRHLDMSDSAH